MIATAIFLFLLGTKIGKISAVQADVKYEPSKITIKEQIDQSPVVIPELGSPPYMPNFVHQGSNYFFGAPFSRSSGFLPLPPRPERVEVIEEEITIPKPQGKVKPPFTNPVIKAETLEIIQNPRLSLPPPSVSLNFQPTSHLPPFSVPAINSRLISQMPVPSLNIPGLPITKSDASCISTLQEGSSHLLKDVIVSKVDVLVKKIPPPPELPPLRLEEIFKPVIVEEKKIILVPSPPEIETMFPPSIIMARQPCSPSKCARHIVFERVLPNIACEKTKTVELISIPASRRQPVVTAPFLSYIIKQ